MLQIAIGVVFNSLGQILVALRPMHKVQGGLWEFPGGKIEKNETPEEALSRELQEEVGITITSSQPLTTCEHHYKDHHVHLNVFRVDAFTGIARGCEGQIIQWVTLEELRELPLLAANHPIVNSLF